MIWFPELTFWCMGKYEPKLKYSVPCIQVFNSESDEKKKLSKYVEKLERVDELVDKLKSKHESLNTNIQYRVWAKTVDSSRHSSADSPRFFKSQTTPRSQQPWAEIVLAPGNRAHLSCTYVHSADQRPTFAGGY